jgi:ADP-ribosylglycohydrolase/fructose-1,6-bisphosphatase/inositol monophosphatase family enzyme
MDYTAPLAVATAAALEAGRHLRAEFHRPGGPRGRSGHAPIDEEVERLIRDQLSAAFPAFGLRGEELGAEDRPPAPGESHFWLVDPNDGTSAMQAGFRGAAVSIGLVRGDVPVLGVIYAYAAPDDDGDLFTWAVGCGPLRRNGVAVARPAFPETLSTDDTILVSQHGDQKGPENARCVAPARFRPVPGIAYRLALVAAGEGAAAVSLFVPRDYDYAAGHALLLGVGGELFDGGGVPVRYRTDRVTSTAFCFGGGPAVCATLAGRDWDTVLRSPRAPDEPYDLVWPAPESHDPDPGRVSRAQGAWLGQLTGDALGSLVEFRGPADIAGAYPDGPRRLADGGTHATLAGQPTDDSEMALLLGRALIAQSRFDADDVAAAYVYWLASGPFDVGGTIGQALRAGRDIGPGTRGVAAALRGAANPDSQANGALMRIAPLGIFGTRLTADRLAELARADAALTHPHPICGDCSAIFTVSIARAIATGARGRTLYDEAVAFAAREAQTADVRRWLDEAIAGPPADLTRQMGWVRWAFTLAYHHAFNETPFESALVDTVRRGGDTDTNAAIVGALLGALQGRDAIPDQWRERVLTCRAIEGLPGVRRPRPRTFWPVDALVLAERLLVRGPAS